MKTLIWFFNGQFFLVEKNCRWINLRAKQNANMTSSIAPHRTTTIIDLNDECQRKLFQYLEKDDLMALAMAVNRFRNVASEFFKCLSIRTHHTLYQSVNHFRAFGAVIGKLEVDIRQLVPSFKREIIDFMVMYCKEKLVDLKLVGLPFTDAECVAMRTTFKHLRKLEFHSGAPVDFPEFLSQSSRGLETLNLTFVPAMNYKKLKLSNLKSLKLWYAHVTDEDIEGIVSRHPQIESLQLKDEKLTEQCLVSIAEHLPQLEELKLEQIKRTSISNIQYLNRLHSLKSLEIRDAWYSSSLPVWKIDFSQLPIERLSIEFVDFISTENADRFIASLATLKTLKYLKLSQPNGMTVPHILNIPEQHSELTEFHFNATEELALTVDNLLYIVQNGPKLQELTYDYLVDSKGGAGRGDDDEEMDWYTERIDADTFKMFGDIMKSRPHKLTLNIFSELYGPLEVPDELEKFYGDSFVCRRQ